MGFITKVAIQKIKNEDVKTSVFSALELINAQQLMQKDNMVVLLKPNILMGKPAERAVNTHPEVVRAVIQWVKKFNPSAIYVSDSAGGQKPGITETAMKESGIQDICEEEGAICVPFEKTEREIYEVKDALELTEISSSRLIREADLIINIPKIKTHWQCTLTCCIKNMFGTVLLANKAKTHAQAAVLDRFCSALVDIYSVSKPQLTVIDGYYCQEGQGPSSGDVVKLDIILTGYDGVALDTTVCKIIGFEPREILYLEKAEEKKLGTTDLERVEFLGETIESVYQKFKRPKLRPISMPLPRWLADYIGKTIFKANVKFNRKKCKLCSTCWTNCPVNAITPPKELKKGNIPVWNSKKCITCFCCVELCPHEAVKFKINYAKNALFSWMGLGFITLLVVITLIFLLILNPL
ncbi:MAG: DUF362 domain-containing protein [Candidatus Lokiarchaeota archaeon]|nr:DUF362 domain-containing protein [Candidatus Lokiarchaeota archaeon]